MTVSEYRNHIGLSFRQFADELGLKSAGYLCEIEEANRCSAKVALAIEGHSKGLVDAASLNDDVALARKAAA